MRRQGTALLVALAMVLVGVGVANAASFKKAPNGSVAMADESVCPTLTATPRPFEAWFNIEDMEKRGFWDPKNNVPWDFTSKLAQVICGAEKGSEIKIGMFFIRALGTMASSARDADLGSRPESDPEVVYDALQWVKKNRSVKVGLVLDGGEITPAGAKKQISDRLKSIADVTYCKNGCFNTNKSSVYPYAINHEKFITISDTVWANKAPGRHPAVLSMSGNFARSQIRNYSQEVTLIYDDVKMAEMFEARYAGMRDCAKTGCSSSSGFPKSMKLKKDRNIWVDPIYRHYTDAGRGTTVSFTPATSTARDFYVQQFDDVDCAVDKNIRIAMFKLTDSKAAQMVDSLVRLRKRGCDIKMLLTYQGGSTTISPAVIKMLSKAKISTKCTTVAMHTKVILIGPQYNNSGRVLTGTQNMSVSGLRYNEEHVITMDTRRAGTAYKEPMRKVYGEYLNGWRELSQSTRSCS